MNGENFESKEIEKTVKQMEKLLAEGGKITFNTDFVGTFNFVRDTLRMGDDGKRNSPSRFAEPDDYQAMLKKHGQGQAIIAEVWAADGTLVGADVGTFNGNLYAADSPGYREGGINYAKMATLAFYARVFEAGIPFMDVAMVTPFTANLRGRYVPASEAIARIDEVNSRPPVGVDLNRPFTQEDVAWLRTRSRPQLFP